jgi:hypothetical protein
MLQKKTPSFPSVINADSIFEIFERLPDGNFIRIARVRGLDEAEKRVNLLALQSMDQYLIHSQGLMF